MLPGGLGVEGGQKCSLLRPGTSLLVPHFPTAAKATKGISPHKSAGDVGSCLKPRFGLITLIPIWGPTEWRSPQWPGSHHNSKPKLACMGNMAKEA